MSFRRPPPPSPQVLRHSRLRIGKPGSQFTDDERRILQSRVRRFFQKRESLAPSGTPASAELQSAKKRAKVIPHLATLDWLKAVDNCIRCGICDEGLSGFHPPAVQFDQAEGPEVNVDSVPLLTLGMDSESKQRSGFFFLRARQFSIVMLQPLHHRKNNDVELALFRAGFMPTMRRRMLIANIAYGPWHSSAFYEDIKDSACDLAANMQADDALLLMLWPRICSEKCWFQPCERSAESRMQYIKDIATSQVATTKGPKASTMRWMSILTAIDYSDKENMTKLLILLYQALQKQWLVSFDELWKPANAPPLAKEISALAPAPTKATAVKAKAKAPSSLRRRGSPSLCVFCALWAIGLGGW